MTFPEWIITGGGFAGIIGYLVTKIDNIDTKKVDKDSCNICAGQNAERHKETMEMLAEIRSELREMRN